MDGAPRAENRLAGPALFAAAAVACLFFATGMVHRPLDDLVGFVSDDAFYYLQTARNLAATGRPTFDGIHATNGYHPGWMAVTTLLAKCFADREMLLRTALAASFLLHLGTSLLLVRLFRRFVSAHWAWILGALWTISPLPVTLAMQGVESSLALLTWVVAIDVFAGRIAPRLGRERLHGAVSGLLRLAGRPPLAWTPAPETPIPARDAAILGAALAAAFWARTDGVVLAGLALLFFATYLRPRTALRAVAIAGGTFAACVLPWFVWSWATTGSLVQDSGAIKMLWGTKAHPTFADAAADGARFVAGRWFGTPASLLLSSPAPVGWALAIAAIVLVASVLVRSLRRGDDGVLYATSEWLAGTVLALGFLDGCLFTDQMVWYFAFPGLALFLVVGLCAARTLGRISALQSPAVHAAGGAALVVGAIFLFSRYRERMPFEYPWQRDVLTSQRAFDGVVPAGARIGCFNAGIPGYFGERTVVNLDGLVNHDLVDVYRRGGLAEWLAKEDVRFIADEPLALGRAQKLTKSPIRLTPVTSAPLRGWPAPTRFLWRVESP